MGYCPENLKFSLSYILHSNIKRNNLANVACGNTYPGGVNASRNFVLHYAGAGPFVAPDHGTINADHYWTGVFQSPPSLGHNTHHLYLDSEGNYRLLIEDHNDPLIQNSFSPYIGNVANELTIPEIVFNSCSKDSDGNLLSPCLTSSTDTSEWLETPLLNESLVVTGADLICRQYISPTITQIGSCVSAPNPQCTISSGHFTIQRNIYICGPSQAGAESDFDSKVPAGAFGIVKETFPFVSSPANDFLSTDVLINKHLYDISPLRSEMDRLTAKLKHYSDIINCRIDSLESVQGFHSVIINSANQNLLADARIIHPRVPENQFYSVRANQPLYVGVASKVFGGTATHMFAVDPDHDNSIHHFMIPNLGKSRALFNTKLDPDMAGIRSTSNPEMEAFIQTIKSFANKVGAKLSKIRKYFEEDFSFCSELAIQKNTPLEAKYVFEGLTYTIEIGYDEEAYSMDDCLTKTLASTTPKTKILAGQTFSIDQELTINID